MKKTTLLALAAGAVLAANASAQLVVNGNLGALPQGVTNVAGDTANGANNADYYDGLTNSAGNWANELVYSFSLSNRSLVDFSFLSESSDTDLFLLNGLNTVSVPPKNAATDALQAIFLDFGPESFIIEPGNYYLSVETFAGFDPAPGPFTSSFSLNLDVQPILPYQPGAPAGNQPQAMNLGTIGAPGDTFTFDTIGSGGDTELGLYDQAGNLILNDDDGGGSLTSLISTEGVAAGTGQAFGGLDAGTYFLAISEYNTAFGTSGFDVTGGLEPDDNLDWILNIDGIEAMSGTLSYPDQVKWLSFTIVPTPSSMALLALGGLAIRRRR